MAEFFGLLFEGTAVCIGWSKSVKAACLFARTLKADKKRTNDFKLNIPLKDKLRALLCEQINFISCDFQRARNHTE